MANIKWGQHDYNLNIWLGIDLDSITTTSSGANYTSISADIWFKSKSIGYGSTWWVECSFSGLSGSVTVPGKSLSYGSENPPRETYIGKATFSGSFGAGSFTISAAFKDQYGEYKYGTNDYPVKGHLSVTTDSFTLPVLLTPCSAPTAVYVGSSGTSTSTTIAPSTVTVRWTAGTAGVGNSISSYNLYYKAGSAPTTSSDVITNLTGTSYTFTNLSSRGTTYYFKVLSVSSAGSSYNSGISSAQATAYINKLPDTPSVTASKQTLSHTGGSVRFDISGSDPDGQSVTFAYATSTTGSKTAITSGSSLDITSSSTYYFWTKDSLGEYCANAASISITVNGEPSISNITASPSTFRALGSSNGIIGYCKGFVNTIKPTISCNKSSGNVSIVLEISPSNNNNASFGSSADATYNFGTYTVSSSKTTPSLNIDTGIENKYDNMNSYSYYRWRLKCSFNDGVEDSSSVYYPESGYYYTIPGASSVVEKYNNSTYDAEISGTTSGHMYKRAGFKIYNDASVTSVSVGVSVNGNPLENNKFSYTSPAPGESDNYRYIKISLNDEPGSGVPIKFTINCYNSQITKKTEYTMYEFTYPSINAPIFPVATGETWTFKPFTGNISQNITLTNPFGTDTNLTTALTNYECDTTASNSIKLILSYNTSSIKSTSGSISINNSNQLVFPINTSTLYGWDNDLGITSYAGVYSCAAKIRITNLYGKVFEGSTTNIKIDFNEPVNTITSVLYYSENSDYSSLNQFITGTDASSDYIQEGLYLRFAMHAYAYTGDKIILQLKCNNNIVSTVNLNAENRATSRTAFELTSNIDFGPVPEIISDSNMNWSITAINNADSKNSAIITTKVLQHTAPVYNYTSCEVDDDYKLTPTFTEISTGGGTLQKYMFGNEAILTNNISATTTTGTQYPTEEYGVVVSPKNPIPTNTYYEYDEPNNQYIPTSDTTPIAGKTYYIKCHQWESLPISIYFVSTVTNLIYSPVDTSSGFISGTTYYTYNTQNSEYEETSQTSPVAGTQYYICNIISKTKYYYSNSIMVYRKQPLVAYRPGTLGVNTKNPETTAVLDIKPTSSQKMIYLGQTVDSVPKHIIIHLEDLYIDII